MQNDAVTIFYDQTLDSAAAEILRIYPALQRELETMFSAVLDVRPQVVLVKDSLTFRKLSRNEFIVAFAIPRQNLVVIDYSRMNLHPFTLRITFKHELCHLLLHRHISDQNLPRWFEEGICQWASDGIGEIFIDKNWSGLDAAIMAGNVLHFRHLSSSFPNDRQGLILAYEQSKSMVNFIDKQYGKNAILDLLEDLKNNGTLDDAVLNRLGISMDDLEKEWLRQLESTPRWLVYLANHLYGILFFLAALLTVCAFIRRIIRRKAWERENGEEWE